MQVSLSSSSNAWVLLCFFFVVVVDQKLPVVSLLSKAAVLCSPLSQLELSVWMGPPMLCRKRFLLLTFTAFRKAKDFMAFACGRDLCDSGLNACIPC